MMKRLLVLLLLPGFVLAQPLNLVSTNVMPWGYLDKEGNPAGLHVEILQQIGKSSGLGYRLKVEPYARVVREIQEGTADISVMFDSKESRSAGYLLTAAEPVNVFLVSRKDSSWQELVEDTDLRIGRMNNSNYGLAKLKLSPDNFVSINTIQQGVAMLMRGRLDGVICTSPAFSLALETLKVDSVDALQAFHLAEIRGAVFLSKKSEYKPEALRPVAQAAVKEVGSRMYQQGRDLSELTLVKIEQK